MPNPTQLTLLGVPARKTGVFRIYHDESGTDPDHSRFQLHGALIVPESMAITAYNALIVARKGYIGRIHFVELRDNTTSLRAQVSSAWLSLFFGDFLNYCFYKCMIVDTHSRSFEPSRFTRPYHLYNYTARGAMVAGVTWSLKDFDEITLSLFSEEVSRHHYGHFIDYLPRELSISLNAKNNKGKKCPQVVEPISPVVLVKGDPRFVSPDMPEHCEFVQLTDLITSAIAQAVNASAMQRIKLDLGLLVAGWIMDVRRPPWLQNKGLHRRFSVSCFPDKSGGFYDVPLEISEQYMGKLIDC